MNHSCGREYTEVNFGDKREIQCTRCNDIVNNPWFFKEKKVVLLPPKPKPENTVLKPLTRRNTENS